MKQIRGNKPDLIDKLLKLTLPEQPQITINALFPLPGLICTSPHPPCLPASPCQAVSSAIVSGWKNPPAAGGRQGPPFLQLQNRCGTGGTRRGPNWPCCQLSTGQRNQSRAKGRTLQREQKVHADRGCARLCPTLALAVGLAGAISTTVSHSRFVQAATAHLPPMWYLS